MGSCLLLGWLCDAVADESAEFSAGQLEFFERHVRPLLSEHCYECHSVGSEKLQAALLVDSRAALIEGGDSGESIVPGDPDDSLFMEAVRWESYEMPPKGKLGDEEIETLAEWIRQGAAWPEEEAPKSKAARPEFDLDQRAAEHWVWQPVAAPPLPEVKRGQWPLDDLDRFILAKLEANDLQPARDVDRLALVRRLYLDLIGLPPTPEELKPFLAGPSPQAIERLVDRLLASPRFGERWGRHWLDLVRYAESRGHEFDSDAVNAYQYRDYVIRALNADVPYDQFVREHLAGDLLPSPRLHPEAGFNESILGTGFWFLGEWVHSPVDTLKDESDRFDNMIDVMSKTFLGVTVSCARCHDHKFDAISTADYYSLTGFLQSSDYRQVRFESMEQNRQVAKEIAQSDADFRAQVRQLLSKHQLTPPESGAMPKIAADRLVLDYRDGLDRGQFLQDGFIYGERPLRLGEPRLEAAGSAPSVRFVANPGARNDPIWNGLKSISQGGTQNRSKLASLPRSGRTLRTPTFELTGDLVACLVEGEGHVVACVDSHRQIAGPLHGETIQAVESGDRVVQLKLSRYVGHRIHLEFTPAEDSQLGVSVILQGAGDELEQAIKAASWDNTALWEQFSSEVSHRAGDELNRLALRWHEARTRLAGRIVERSHTAMAMMDGTGEDAHVYIRGNSSKPGDRVPRRFLTAISGGVPLRIEAGSGRLELADQVNDPGNPLTTRVIANRVWHHLMGRGLVPTTDDFGVLGQRPTHPELLDHLATRFREDGLSIKRLIRYIVLSRSYQMSSKPDTNAVRTDPKNLLWHHRPPKRLEAETIRDALLTVSGRLNTKAYGPSVPVHLTDFMKGLGRPSKSGPADGEGRRSVYLAVRRNFLSPFMLTFDKPTPFSTMGRRNVSNVPAQSLILMNDPFVFQQARVWAEQALQHGKNAEGRVRWMYLAGFAREPAAEELAAASEFVGSDRDIERWTALAHALFNTKEFIFIR